MLEGSHFARNIIVQWPLVILGIVGDSGKPHLECEQGADAALDVR